MRYGLNRRTVVMGLAAGAAGLGAGSLQGVTEALAQDQMDGFGPLAKAAANEGPAAWYESTATEAVQPCIATFNKRYPAVQIRHVRAIGAGDLATKIIQESRTGGAGTTADVLTTTSDQVYGIASRGLALDVEWTDYGIPEKFVPEKYALICNHNVFCIIYNTQRVAEAPRGWDYLIDPRWKGKIGSPAFSHPYAMLVAIWGEARVDDFMGKFVQNAPVLTPSTYTLAQQVASGELLAAVGNNWTVRPVIRAGGPVKIAVVDPAPISINYCVIPKMAKNVNSAKLFSAWLTTDEGAQAYEAATGRGNALRNTELSNMNLPTWAAFRLDEAPKYSELVEKYNRVLRRG